MPPKARFANYAAAINICKIIVVIFEYAEVSTSLKTL
jgi:hypothetical protein